MMERTMIQQKPDRFAAWRDTRPFTEIQAEKGYVAGFWNWKNGPKAESNVVGIRETFDKLKEAAHG